MKFKNWITCVQDRGEWKDVVEKAITFKTLTEVQCVKKKKSRRNKQQSLSIQDMQRKAEVRSRNNNCKNRNK